MELWRWGWRWWWLILIAIFRVMSIPVNITKRTASRRHDSVFTGIIIPHSLKIKSIFLFKRKSNIIKTKQSCSLPIIWWSIQFKTHAHIDSTKLYMSIHKTNISICMNCIYLNIDFIPIALRVVPIFYDQT